MTSRHRSSLHRSSSGRTRVISAPPAIGLDIGTKSVRAIETAQTKGRPTVSGFGSAPLPEGAMSGGVMKDERAVTSALKALWAAQDFNSKSVRLAVSHQQVVVREVEIANLPAKDRRQALPHQVRDALPLPVEQAILDFHPLESTDSSKETIRGLLVAVPKEPVLETVHAVERAGLRVEKVDLACFAVLRAVASAGAEVIIDIGAGSTLVVIHEDGIPHIVRTIPRGGDEVTRLLSTRLAISTADAETLKCTLASTPDGEYRREGFDAVRDALRPLIGEIRSSLNFYINSAPGRTVDRLTLVGRASQLPDLAAELRASTELPVRTGDPMQYVGAGRRSGLRDDLANFRTVSAVSVGLTLGTVQ